MSDFNTIRNSIQTLRIEQVEKQEELFLVEQELERIKNKKVKIPPRGSTIPGPGSGTTLPTTGGGPGKGGILTPPGGINSGIEIPNETIIDLRTTLLSTKRTQLIQRIDQIVVQLQTLFNQFWLLGNPQQLVEHWDDGYPVLLMPIRLETRFLTDPNTAQKYLGVRFFPDDIFVNTHEKALTADEIAAGKTFWKELWASLGEIEAKQEEVHKGAWRTLANRTGQGRAAYIAINTRPSNWPSNPSLPPTVPDPVFAEMAFKNNSWGLPPRAYALPDKFVVRLYNSSGYREVVAGAITAYPLVLGPNPGSEKDIFEEGTLQWLFDFDRAVQEGMAVKILLSNQEYAGGFDKIIVLGVRLSSDISNSQTLLQGLVDSHHYGLTGFGLLPQGTPTNNTKEKPSGFSAFRPDIEFAYNVERGNNLISDINSTPPSQRKDGQWLGLGLGIDESVLHHIAYANQCDRREAMLMNEALWPATLGYYLKHLLAQWATLANNTIGLSDIEELKTFFINHISGRGSMPAIRVGNQPYGILPVSAFSRLEWSGSESFAGKLSTVLHFFQQSWSQKIGHVKTAGAGSPYWQQDFLDILGLNSGSVEFHQRSAVGPLLYYLFLKFAVSPPPTADQWLTNKLNGSNLNANSINNLASGTLLAETTRVSMLTWFFGGNPIKGDLITPDPLSEETPLGKDYLKYLSNPSNIRDVIKEYLNKSVYSNTLLYRLLRHAYLLEVWEALWKKDNTSEWIEKEYLNLYSTSLCDSIWYYYANENGEIKEEALAYLRSHPKFQNFLSTIGQLLGHDKSIPTARLERLLTEHLDLCTYRLDAWLNGLVDYRLNKMRAVKPKGACLGAFGWLLDVRKDPDRTVVPDSEIPSPFTNTEESYPLTYETGNAGFVHAPSIAQATTSAILREGYLSKGEEAMQVNISSKRVRLAREIIQGLQNGQELGALLGYRFERSLHEKSADNATLELDKYIYRLRKKFPLSDKPDAARDGAVEANNVVHGLNLLKSFRSSAGTIQNYIDTPQPTPAELNEINQSIEELENIIDAIADLTMAEGVHQSVLGNHIRAGAILNAIGEGKRIPEPDFIETPRSGIALTQRVGLLLKTNSANPWSSVPMTPRAIAEPVLNRWIGETLGDPGQIKCQVIYVENAGTETETEVHTAVCLEDLSIQPIDAVFLFNTSLNEGNSELAQRIAYFIRYKEGLLKDVIVKIDFRSRGNWLPSEKSFFEILPLVRSIYKIITNSQVMEPEHLINASSIGALDDLPRDYDLVELQNRVDQIDLNSLEQELNAHIITVSGITDFSGAAERLKVEKLRNCLLKASNLDISGAIPDGVIDYDNLSIEALKQKANRVIQAIKAKLDQIDELVPGNSTQKEWLTDVLKIIVGREVPIMTRFKLNNFDNLKSSYEQRALLIRKSTSLLVMDEWLQGVSKVREKLKTWHLFTFLSDSIESPVTKELTPLQLPFQERDQWLGIEFDESEIKISGDPLSLVLNLPNGFIEKATDYCCGLILDDWTEKIPNRKETTGIVFNYDEPQAEPPQSLLLVVPPKITGKWKWVDIMDALNDTLEVAKIRAIDPDLLGAPTGSSFNPFLPGLIQAITSDHKQTVALNLGELNANTPS